MAVEELGLMIRMRMFWGGAAMEEVEVQQVEGWAVWYGVVRGGLG